MSLELETERLRLRQLRESDHETLAQNHADPELTRFLGGPATPVDSWRWLLTMLGHWSLAASATGLSRRRRRAHFAARAGLIRHFDWPETEFGWRVFREQSGPRIRHRGRAARPRIRLRRAPGSHARQLHQPGECRLDARRRAAGRAARRYDRASERDGRRLPASPSLHGLSDRRHGAEPVIPVIETDG